MNVRTETIASVEQWPVYVTDSGVVFCHYPACQESDEWFYLPSGRRGTMGEYLGTIREHAHRVHGIDLL